MQPLDSLSDSHAAEALLGLAFNGARGASELPPTMMLASESDVCTSDRQGGSSRGSGFPKISGYRLHKVLGQGGMGKVYAARQESLNRDVAIKVLSSPTSEYISITDRFRREAQAIARLKHPNIVAIYDFGLTADGAPYYAMEFVEGVNLAQRIRHDSSLSLSSALELTRQVCDALDYAHNCGIVHRDIKPANILLDRFGNAKVADFGLVRVMDGDNDSRSRTMSGLVMGTPNYMAPEQAQDSASADHRADIFSVGVIFYEMLTGELPLGSFKKPSAHVPGLDAQVDRITQHALEPHREDRYQSAAHIRTDVEKVLQRLPKSSTRQRLSARKKRADSGSPGLLARSGTYAWGLAGISAILLPIWAFRANPGDPGKTQPVTRNTPFKLAMTGNGGRPHLQLSIDGKPLDDLGGPLPADIHFPLVFKFQEPGFNNGIQTIALKPKDHVLRITVPSLVRSSGKVHVTLPGGSMDYPQLELRWLGSLKDEESAPPPAENQKVKFSQAPNVILPSVPTGRYRVLLSGAEPRMLDQALPDIVEVRSRETAEVKNLPASIAGTYRCDFNLTADDGRLPLAVRRVIALKPGLAAGVCVQSLPQGSPFAEDDATEDPSKYSIAAGSFSIGSLQFDPDLGIRGVLLLGSHLGQLEEHFTIKGSTITFKRPFASPSMASVRAKVSYSANDGEVPPVERPPEEVKVNPAANHSGVPPTIDFFVPGPLKHKPLHSVADPAIDCPVPGKLPRL